ncbi:hypothetical protein BH09PLA1_BH09PLA1_04270 [soil metagenome]
MLKRIAGIVAALALVLSLAAVATAQAHDDHHDKHGDKHDGGAMQEPGQAMPKANPGQGYFGAKFGPVSDEKAEELGLDSQDGVVIMEVLKDSPAEKAGLKEDDVVKKLDDKEVEGVQGFVAVMRASKPDQQLKVSIIREKQPQDVTVTLAKRPASMDELDKQMQKERMEKEKGMENEHGKGPATKPN